MELGSTMFTFLQEQIDKERIPGAVISVIHRNRLLFRGAIGYRQLWPDRQPMTVDTVFDLASLTKVVCTLPLILQLWQSRRLSLHMPVADVLPSFGANGKESVTLFQLLTHSAGLPASVPFYKEGLNKNETIARVCQLAPTYTPGSRVVYSDVGFIALGAIIEQVTGKKLQQVASEWIYSPLGMQETQFCPRFPATRYAATEWDNWLGRHKCGEVHDENAFAMGGVSGHAGLFSTVSDLEKFAYDMQAATPLLIDPNILYYARQNFSAGMEEPRGLGWIVKGTQTNSSCGRFFSSFSYGHLGFTGTSMWFDPVAELAVIFLTNRVHLGRDNHAIRRIRPALHDLIYQCLFF
ncbi:serine hydrolase domain-containing protein [Shouchella tritolerans]|uniref:serine hydrolase domain-containing protein n=1 Tax=Shouchella tritolerans TaxID=2979466 RepID=UPI000A7DF78D|nr:serine hydrolase domain-containing protein [Shouchella tritolerans]